MSRARALALIPAIALAAAAPASAQTHTDFSGVWVLDRAHSDSSSFTPRSATYSVQQRGDSLIVDRVIGSTRGDSTVSHMVYLLNGEPTVNSLPLVGTTVETTSIASWNGTTLTIRSTSHPNESELIQTDSWSLSPDRTTLAMRREASYAGQSMGSPNWVFIKRSP